MFSKGGVFEQLKKQMIEKILSKELEQELGYSKHSKAKKKSINRRNGSYEKTITGVDGCKLTIDVPRDREDSYEPQLIPKGMRRFKGFDERIISLYSRAMTMIEIQAHLEEIYHTKVSKDLISTITDGVMEEAIRWQNRPLDQAYPILYLDCIHVKC